MTVAAAGGVRRALRGGRGAAWGPRLLAGYGLALVVAGVFRADPMDGFPLGTPAGPATEVRTSGLVHMAAGGLGSTGLIATTWVLGARLAAEGRRAAAWCSRLAGPVLLAGFAGVASGSTSGSTSPVAVLGLRTGVVTGWAWLAAVSVHLYRRTPPPTRPRA
jgi:uncharacterized protein DUF998